MSRKCSVRNKMLVENGSHRVIGSPVRDGMWVENAASPLSCGEGLGVRFGEELGVRYMASPNLKPETWNLKPIHGFAQLQTSNFKLQTKKSKIVNLKS